jgi:hypothetical protein
MDTYCTPRSLFGLAQLAVLALQPLDRCLFLAVFHALMPYQDAVWA